VAFENPRKLRLQQEREGGVSRRHTPSQKLLESDAKIKNKVFQVPDRVTGLEEVEELRRICPGRIWNFVRLLPIL